MLKYVYIISRYLFNINNKKVKILNPYICISLSILYILCKLYGKQNILISVDSLFCLSVKTFIVNLKWSNEHETEKITVDQK